MTFKLSAALAKAQAEMKNAHLNKVNPHFKSKYADLAGIRDTVLPALAKNGIAVTQTTHVEGGWLVLDTALRLDEEIISGAFPVIELGRATPQQMGSALTYARRYALAAIACISADEDDDANAAEAAPKANKPVVVTKGQKDAPKADGPVIKANLTPQHEAFIDQFKEDVTIHASSVLHARQMFADQKQTIDEIKRESPVAYADLVNWMKTFSDSKLPADAA